MVSSNKFFSSVYLAICYASYAQASIWEAPVEHAHATRRSLVVGRGLPVEVYHPSTNYEVFGEGLDKPESFDDSIQSSTEAFVAERLKVDPSSIAFKSGFEGETAQYGYAKQAHNDIPFINAVANVAFKGNKVVAFGSSFVPASKIADSTPTIDAATAIAKAEEALDGKYNDHPTTLEYLVKPDGTASLVHTVQVQDQEKFTWYEAYVDAHDGKVLSVTNFVAGAAYKVLPITKIDIRSGLETLTNPADTVASPNGWHTANATAGNNVVAYKGTQASTTAQSGANLVFDYTYDPAQAPATTLNVNAARTNAFYLINKIHDVSYRYGFTESAYNFQTDNYGKGGSGNDRVLMSVQDSSGTNNANFATPPDGQSGQCRMYIWTMTTPNRDGSLENDIPIHEYTHGISNRLTGGGTGRCLQTTEAGGMGEGWSDAFADWFQAKASFADFVLGAYVTNNPAGIRTHPYTTDFTRNPLLYSSLTTRRAVHQIGTVWANMLHNILAELIAKYGFDANAGTNPAGTSGNNVWLHLFIDSLALQPCNPTFVTARNAWLQADVNRYAGANRCLIYGVFAKRGLGTGAASGVYTDSFAVPSGC